MKRKQIRKKVNRIIKKFDTTDPYQLCECLGIDLYWDDLGKNIMGLRTKIKRIPGIVLNIRNTDTENIDTCLHELGHHICNHNTNVEALNRTNRRFVSYGVEYEANCCMVEIMLYNAEIKEYETKQQVIEAYGIPKWAEDYVDWDYLLNK